MAVNQSSSNNVDEALSDAPAFLGDIPALDDSPSVLRVPNTDPIDSSSSSSFSNSFLPSKELALIDGDSILATVLFFLELEAADDEETEHCDGSEHESER
eukprot:TRINITY_DN3699_c0_g1_i4.p2 TRINITY_DN3699_c0_g1~~TRINITY_DN3699_c0_g1_i4.p2  ORF type:complete len:100 (+),score=29.51 TRINITY_DN3699_c0_g1_i4:378-677(+)